MPKYRDNMALDDMGGFTDTDQGIFTGKKGEIYSNGVKIAEDTCYSTRLQSGRVQEGVIENFINPQTRAPDSFRLSCPAGCSEGACNSFTPAPRREIIKQPNICEGYSEAVAALQALKANSAGSAKPVKKSSIPVAIQTEAGQKAAELTQELIGMAGNDSGVKTLSTGQVQLDAGLIAKARERKLAMLLLAHTGSVGEFMNNSIIGKFSPAIAQALGDEIEKEISVTGNIEVWADVGKHKEGEFGNENLYKLTTGTKTYNLSTSDASRLPETSGARMQIDGIAIGETDNSYIIMQSAQNRGISLKSTATPPANDNIGLQKAIIVYSHAPGKEQTRINKLPEITSEVSKYFAATSPAQFEFEIVGSTEARDVYFSDGTVGVKGADIISYLDSQLGARLKDYSTIIMIDERVPGNCLGTIACATIGKGTIYTKTIGVHKIRQILLEPSYFDSSELAEGADILKHELGHGLGAQHSGNAKANSSGECSIAAFSTDADYQQCGGHVGYHAVLDPMNPVYGSGPIQVLGSFNSAHQEKFGWLQNKVQTITSNGIYTLSALGKTSGIAALKIPVEVDNSSGNQLNYYLEFRTDTGYDHGFGSWTNVYDGPVIYMSGYKHTTNLLGSENVADTLLVMFPPYDTSDIYPDIPNIYAVPVGKTFFDFRRDLAIRTLSKTADSVTVQVVFHPNCGSFEASGAKVAPASATN